MSHLIKPCEMKKLHLVVIINFILFNVGFSQTYIKEFGKIGKDEIELETYSKDKNAEAVVLFDIGKSTFVDAESGYDVLFERMSRVKILSEAGIEYSEIEIPFYREDGIFEKVYDIEAYTYNFEDGAIKKEQLDLTQVYDEVVNEYWTYKKFAMPNVKVGSIIEYKYKLRSEFIFNLQDWEFQWKIPVVYSEYTVGMIPFYNYSWVLRGTNKLDVYEEYEGQSERSYGITVSYGNSTFRDMFYTFGMKDQPAFNDEEFITSINDYITKIDFQLAQINQLSGAKIEIITTWEKLVDELLSDSDFGKFIKKSEKEAAKAIDVSDLGSERERFDKVLDYMKNNFSWNNFNSYYASKSAKDFFVEKTGNCADINLFTVGMLHSTGIKAYPVLMSTRSHGKILYNYPYSSFFNYLIVLAEVDGEMILTDATEIYGLNDRIPTRCINDKGLIVSEDQIEWVTLECLHPSEMNTELTMEFEDGIINGNFVQTSTEYDALYYRNRYADDVGYIKDHLDDEYYNVNTSTIAVENFEDRAKPYVLKYELSAQPEVINDKIYVSPFLGEIISENPLKQNSRKYDIDMTYSYKENYTAKIKIPEGYHLDYIPENEVVNNDIFSFDYKVEQQNEELIVSCSYFFKKSVYSPEMYARLKLYFNKIIEKGNDKLVFTKTI